MEPLKEWTFLLYANGHNELEPEIWKSVADLQAWSGHPSVHVAAQVSRAEQDVVSLLRPHMDRVETEQWSGVRRYAFSRSATPCVDILEPINMAHPEALCDFLRWAIPRFPAKRYILSVTGHIYQFVGMCPDYSAEGPFMLGFPELSGAIQETCRQTGAQLSILVLDTCYASTVEILYELGRYASPRVQTVLTYIGKGPLAGLSYPDLLSILAEDVFASTADLLRRLVSDLSLNRRLYGLIGLQINHEALELLKQLFSRLASVYQLCGLACAVELTPEELLSQYREDYPWSHYLKPIQRLLNALILARCSAEEERKAMLPIHILYQKIPDAQRRQLYARLSFSKENHWTRLLCGPSAASAPTPSAAPAPIPITKNILAAFIYAGNEELPLERVKSLVEALIQTKGWNLI